MIDWINSFYNHWNINPSTIKIRPDDSVNEHGTFLMVF